MREPKVCISCKQEKPRDDDHFFYRNKSRGWFSSWCKECRKRKRSETKDAENERQRQRRGGHPCKSCGARTKYSSEHHLCKKCEPVDMFTLSLVKTPGSCRTCGKSLDGICGQRYCSKCSLERHKERKRREKCLYRSRLRKATPPWADKEKIREFYSNRPKGMHVDHIIPIRGENVCGFHVHYNLQYLTPEENISKSNRYPLRDQGRK